MEKYQKEPLLLLDYGFTLKDTFQLLNIPIKKDFVILVNGRRTNKDYILKSEDQITVFPPVDGG